MTPETIADSILDELSERRGFCLYVFWLQCRENRAELHERLSALLDGSGAVPLVLRRQLFHDPNGWAADAVSLLEENRAAVEAKANLINSGSPIALVVIARGDLAVAQSASPATAPAWLPRYGGREINTYARDLTASAACPMNSPESAIGELCTLIYELDVRFCSLASQLSQLNVHHGLALWSTVLKDRTEYETRADFLDQWRIGLTKVTDARSYRPSLRSKWSMVAAMWATFMDNAPAKLLGLSKHYCEFLGIDDLAWITNPPGPESALLPILFRGANDRPEDRVAIAGRGLIVSVGLACQLATAAAHADQYGKVNATALAAVSRELRAVLASADRAANATLARASHSQSTN